MMALANIRTSDICSLEKRVVGFQTAASQNEHDGSKGLFFATLITYIIYLVMARQGKDEVLINEQYFEVIRKEWT